MKRDFTKAELKKIAEYDPNNLGGRERKTMKVVDTNEFKVCYQVAPGIWKCAGNVLLDDKGHIIG